MGRAFRILAALIVWTGLLLQYWLLARGRGGEELVYRTINFFSYFTILSNILCAVCLTAPRATRYPTLRTGVALYISVTGAVYVLILKDLWAPTGLQWVADTLLHYVTPALFLIDWTLLSPKGALKWRSALTWLGFPLLYAVWTLAHGAQSGFWPYPFMDASKLGMTRVLTNMAGLIVAFLGLSLLFVVIDRALARLRRA
jgi:hypothetical protein